LREVHIAAELDSPHVVRVLEVGSEGAPLPYLAMERLQGEDLAQILRRERRLKSTRVIELVRQAGRGIAAASAAGIVHRDIKPQNLFLCEGRPRLWKILDFGVSKRVASDGALTQGEAIGTPHYMAPEQATGNEVDMRADLYGLGAIAYRALTGHQPFSGSDIAAILFKVVCAMPQRPSALVDVDPDVDLALAIALAKTPDKRFDDAEELADALAAALRGKLGDAYRRRAGELLAELPWADEG
jgi:serine/threonine-protein kinase